MPQQEDTYFYRGLIIDILKNSDKGLTSQEISERLYEKGHPVGANRVRYIIESTSPFGEVFEKTSENNRVRYGLSKGDYDDYI